MKSGPEQGLHDTEQSFPSSERSLWIALVDLVATKTCGGCGRPPRYRSALCGGCAAALTAESPRRAVTIRGRVFACAHYEDPVRSMVIQYKERSRMDLARPLGAALADSVAAVAANAANAKGSVDTNTNSNTNTNDGIATTAHINAAPLTLIPMPSTRKAVRRRGDDSTARLARVAAAELRSAGVPVRILPVLRHARRVADQAGLDRVARVANLDGALRVPERHARLLAGARVVLVDDVVTTGATLAEAARVVRLVGADVVGGAAVAAARFVR